MSRGKILKDILGKYRLQTVLTVSILAIFVIAIGITGLLSYMNCQFAVGELAGQLQHQTTDRIVQHLDTYLKTPVLVNEICLDSIGSVR